MGRAWHTRRTPLMTATRYMLAIDLGTSGPKVALVGEDGRLAARAVRRVPTQVVPGGGAEQDAAEIWRAVLDASSQTLAQADVPRDAVIGVVCDSHYFSLIPVDADGNALMNCIVWMDQRGAPYTMAIYGREPDSLGRWIEVHGLPAIPSGIDSLAHLLFVKHERPEVYERTHAFVEPMDFVNAQLTGVVAANACTAYPLLLTDNRRLDDVHYDDALVRMTGVDRTKLPPLLPIGESIGTLRTEVAAELGLSPTTRVFAGMNDTQAVAVGAGTFQPGQGGINIGTTTQILAHIDGMRGDLENSILSMPSALAGRYMALAENGLGGKLLEHFVENVVYPKDAFADHSTEDAYARIEPVVAAEPVGSGGLLFLPWFTGLQTPIIDPNARGAFLNVSLSTTRTRMMRAIVEGISFNMRWLLPAVEAVSGHPFDELRFSGGGAMSDEWSQIMADVMARPVLQVDDARYLNAKGAAFAAFTHAGLTGLDQIDRFCPIKRRYEPRAQSRDVYARLFAQFVAAYEQNRPIFAALNTDAALAAPPDAGEDQ